MNVDIYEAGYSLLSPFNFRQSSFRLDVIG
jgi:hypothetical protein